MRSLSFTANNQLTLLRCGAEFFPALIAAIDAAVYDVYLETYIFALDSTAGTVIDALGRAADRGVIVNVIVDWLGTERANVELLRREFAARGINYRVFNPWFRRGVARTHRKMCVVDRKVAFVGGLNINDDMLADHDPAIILPAPRWDFAVRIVGALVAQIQLEIESQWRRLGPLKLAMRWELFRKIHQRRATSSEGSMLAALVVRDNLRNRRTIERAYLQALGRARKRVLFANPYFAPSPKLRRALESAALRGINVTLLLGVGQFAMQDAVAHSFYPKLLKCGVKIVEYRKTQLHAKVAVVDDNWATVGSSNYDGLSLFLNHEANVMVNDARFADRLGVQIEQGIADGVPVRLEDYINIPWYRRMWYGTAFFIYETAIRMVTWSKYR